MITKRADNAYLALIEEFPLVPLRDKSEFDEAVNAMKTVAGRINSLTSSESDYLTVLGDLITQYEKKLPRLAEETTPREALAYLMEVNGLAQTDLVEYVGHKSNLSAFLSGQRGLSKRAACRLAEYFSVSPTLFMPKE